MANINEQDKNFKKVRFYQDKILLETELNELQDIQNRRFEDGVYDSLGNVVIYGFDVKPVSGWQVSINLGRAYIGGKVVTNKGAEDLIDIVGTDVYEGDLTLYAILVPQNKVYLPEEEGDKGWEYGIGEPTTYRTEESYVVVLAQAKTAIIKGGITYAIALPTDKSSYIELARILRPNTAESISDCIIRDTRDNLIMKLGGIVNKKFYMKAEQQYDSINDMKSSNELLITPNSNTKDDRDRICVDLTVCHAEVTDNETTSLYDVNGNKITVASIITQDVNGETLDEAVVTLSGDIAETVYVPIVGENSLLLNENSDFESGSSNPDKWIPFGAPIFNVSDNNNFDIGVSNNNSYKSENYIDVIGSTDYIITALLKADNNTSLNYQFSVEWYDGGKILINTEIKEIVITNEYKKYIALVTAPTTAVYAKILLNGNINNSDLFWVDSVEFLNNISTPNLLTDNSSLDSGSIDRPKGWVLSGTPVYYKDNLNSVSGADYVKVSYNNSFKSENFINVSALNEYILTAYIKAISGSFNYKFKIEWYNENEVYVSTDIKEIVVTSNYAKYVSVFKVPENATKAKILLDGDGVNSSNWFYVDNVELLNNLSTGNLFESIEGSNIGFESSTSGPFSWIKNGNAEYISDGTQSYNGNCAVKVSYNNTFESENFITITADNEYVLVAYLKALTENSLKYSFKINWYNSSQILLNSEVKSIEINTNYKKYISIFKAPTGSSYMKLELVGDNSVDTNWFMVDSMEFLNNVSTANLLTNNYSFETINGSNPSGWTKIGSPIYSTDGTQSYIGNCAVKVSYGNVYQSDQKVSVVAGNNYIIGAYIKADGVSTKCRFKVDWYDSSVELIDTTYEYFYVAATYNHYYIMLNAPVGAVSVNIVIDGDGIDSNNWFWYDSIQIYNYNESATNLIANENSNFEDSDPDEWTRTGNPEYVHDSYEGLDSIKVSFNNYYKSNKLIKIDETEKYIVGAYIKANGISTQCRILIEWYDNSEVLLGSSYENIVVTTDYKHYYTMITPISDSVYAKIVLDGDGINSSNWFYYDNIEFYTYDNEAANFVVNDSFEIDNIDYWSTIGLTEYLNGEIKVSKDNICGSDQFISVLESNEYIIGASIKAVGAETKCRILVEWYDEYYSLISSSYENIIVTTDYRHYYTRIVSPASIVKYMRIVLDGDGIDSNNWFWYNNIEVYDYDESAINLILGENPNFNEGKYVVSKWKSVGSPVYSTSGFDSYKDNDALKVSYGNSFESENFINVSEKYSYKINAFIKSLISSTYQFRINWYNGSQELLSSSTKDVTVNSDNFKECFSIVIAPESAQYMKVVLNGDGSMSNNWFWVDNISILHVTEHNQFPIVLHYGYEYTLANLPANFAMADIVSGVSIDMAIQEILGNRYFDGSLPIASDGTNSIDRRLVELWDELHTHRHKGLISPRLEARDIDLINPPGVTTQKTVEDHVTLLGDGQADNNNPHGLSAKDIDVKLDEIPYPNEYSDDTLKAKTDIHGRVDVSIADHILEIGTGIPDSKNPHGLDSSDIEHNAETNPDNSFKTIEQALFDRVKDLHGDGVVRGLRIFAEDNSYVKITDGYAYVNGKRIRIGNSVVINELLVETETNKIFRITGALVNDLVYVTYFDANNYYKWVAKVYQENGMLKVDISDANLSYNYNGVDILSYNNLKLDNNEKFEMQLNSNYQQISIPNLSNINDRIDILIVSDNGIISLVRGIEDGRRRKPIVPNNSIKIAEIYVNYNNGTDNITYDDVNDCRNRIDWKHNGGSSTTIYSNGEADINVLKKLQSLDTTIDYYKQLFVSASDIGFSLSRMAVETFVDNTNKDNDNSNNVQIDDSNIYLGNDEEPVLSMDLVADWRNFGSSGGIGTWVSKTYIGDHTLGLDNLLDINNYDFELGSADPLYWSKIGSPVYDVSGNYSYKGLKAIKVSANNSYTTQNFISVVATKSYKILAYIKADQINVNCRFKATWYNAVQAYISESSVFVKTTNSKYDKYEAVLVAPIGASFLKITLDGDGTNSNNYFWFDSLELIELTNIDKVLLFSRETLNGGNNKVRYYLSNNGTIPTEEAQPNRLHTFSTIGSELRVKIEIEPNNNNGDNQPRVHSFALVWGIGQGHNHNGENSSNVLGEDVNEDNLTVMGGLTLIGPSYSVVDVASLLNYLKPPEPPTIGNYINDAEQEIPRDDIINGPSDMRLNLSNFNFVENAYIPSDAILLNGTSITVGSEHDGVTALPSSIDVTCYIYPADRGYVEVTVNNVILGSLNLTEIWMDDTYTDRTQVKLNQLPRTLTEQLVYPMNGGIHGEGIELSERMTYVPAQTDRPLPYYQTAKCRFIFNPYSWQNSLGVFGKEELGKIKITHYTDPTKLTIISSEETVSIFNDVELISP